MIVTSYWEIKEMIFRFILWQYRATVCRHYASVYIENLTRFILTEFKYLVANDRYLIYLYDVLLYFIGFGLNTIYFWNLFKRI
jgi:hypothetical protein